MSFSLTRKVYLMKEFCQEIIIRLITCQRNSYLKVITSSNAKSKARLICNACSPLTSLVPSHARGRIQVAIARMCTSKSLSTLCLHGCTSSTIFLICAIKYEFKCPHNWRLVVTCLLVVSWLGDFINQPENSYFNGIFSSFPIKRRICFRNI